MYHLRKASLNVLTINLHFSMYSTVMVAIWVLMEIMCSLGSLLPSNGTKDGGWKLSGAKVSQISVVSD